MKSSTKISTQSYIVILVCSVIAAVHIGATFTTSGRWLDLLVAAGFLIFAGFELYAARARVAWIKQQARLMTHADHGECTELNHAYVTVCVNCGKVP
jgi:hypothetical protein